MLIISWPVSNVVTASTRSNGHHLNFLSILLYSGYRVLEESLFVEEEALWFTDIEKTEITQHIFISIACTNNILIMFPQR